MATEKTPKPLKTKFSGKGEVLGYLFTQLEKGSNSYLWEVKNEGNGSVHYEVFKERINERFNCVSYPKSKSFGIWAWTKLNLEDAKSLMKRLEVSDD